jgi:hypothetical protein
LSGVKTVPKNTIILALSPITRTLFCKSSKYIWKLTELIYKEIEIFKQNPSYYLSGILENKLFDGVSLYFPNQTYTNISLTLDAEYQPKHGLGYLVASKQKVQNIQKFERTTLSQFAEQHNIENSINIYIVACCRDISLYEKTVISGKSLAKCGEREVANIYLQEFLNRELNNILMSNNNAHIPTIKSSIRNFDHYTRSAKNTEYKSRAYSAYQLHNT